MDQRSTIGSSATLARPIHRACVVPNCPCGSVAPTARRSSEPRLAGASIRSRLTGSINLTDIALRSVGLPIA